MKIGFVGLGTMGRPMARRLLAAGHELACASRSPGPVRELAALGAQPLPTAADVVARSEITFLCLPDDEAVRSVVRECLPVVRGRVIVDHSTVGPATETQLGELVREAGGHYLDAPVSGGPQGAEAGTLAVMVGGDPDVFETARPVIDAYAGYLALAGDVGAGQVVKLCNQVLVCAQLLTLAECAELAQSSGVDPQALHDALAHSTGDSFIARSRFPVPGVAPHSPASNDWRPDFTTALMHKDIDLAWAHGNRVGAPPLSALRVLDLLAQNIRSGNAGLDFSSFATLVPDRPRQETR
ncbi:NAD(P)-dependent oxidoreductase [Frankia sp. CNm7]|uniref:NAD(P)-dependent oxidoreductase n=1 Tax=Frankia nepalensis TaxID=1836974 RepID=A0A937RDV1_9ACTN|nr:NAD(P)-dependent oxidoreductase [Frankia nepalensis]MBL7498850.1 NAD(P)-dependent oxidoreductase [Frankia nepalensis]MBL7508655.1 NAD(P)-dependent oxidoreductase [Frankia nepalensis]MBL7521453.1 NAD(P)-dependent oxidoreductase [Frankia nepalensis]MBL7628432.1 NAD(P)-dependent oxidoreductase [Frankia nepalensis]